MRQVASGVAISRAVNDRVAELTEIREARAPKLILVGSLSPEALEIAEAVFRGAIGPCAMVKVPVAAQGTDLLAGEWGVHAREKGLEHLGRQPRRPGRDQRLRAPEAVENRAGP